MLYSLVLNLLLTLIFFNYVQVYCFGEIEWCFGQCKGC